MASKKMHVFTYGSLMFAPVWNKVVRRSYRSTAASLAGHVRRPVKNEAYPVIYPATAERVSGLLYFDVAADDLRRLDLFEGEYYQRQSLSVCIADGSTLVADTYVVKPQFRHIAAAGDWDPEYFRRHGMQAFLRRYQGFLQQQLAGVT
ncbi:MAG: gamma-glutamylcyclotransferase [Chromatiales bacterium]